MLYNKERLDEFIKNLGMKTEINKLFETGLTYEQLAGAINNVFDKEYLTNKLGFKYLVSKSPKSATDRNIEIFKKRYGVGSDNKLSYKKLAKEFKITIERARNIVLNIERKLFPEKDFLHFLDDWKGPDRYGFYTNSYYRLFYMNKYSESKLKDILFTKPKKSKLKGILKKERQRLGEFGHRINMGRYKNSLKVQLGFMESNRRKYKSKIKQEIYYKCLDEICKEE